jgi:hypothetical protein
MFISTGPVINLAANNNIMGKSAYKPFTKMAREAFVAK